MPTKPSSSTDSPEGTLRPSRILDGRAIAHEIHDAVRAGVDRLLQVHRVRPGLAVIIVGEDPASRIYVETKQRACADVGIACQVYRLDAAVTEDELVHLIYGLNRDRNVHGILLQLPLPERALENPALAELAPDKDVDGLSPTNQARLLTGERGLRPCTPLAVMELIARTGIELGGTRAVIVGTSALVGKPLAMMLLEHNATVVMCHEFTRNLAEEVAAAEVLVSAVGRAGLIRGEWVRPGAAVIDVGINRTDTGLRGDVEYEAASQHARFITPVPGGVGPMTVAMLLRNTLAAAEQIAVHVR